MTGRLRRKLWRVIDPGKRARGVGWLVDFATLVAPDAIGDAVARYLRGGSALRRRLAATPSPFGDGSASRTIVAQVRSRYCVGTRTSSDMVRLHI
jgi:hypothetical protein